MLWWNIYNKAMFHDFDEACRHKDRCIKDPPLSYMERGVESDTDTALAPPLIPHPELLWSSLIQTTTIMKLSRPFPPSNIQQWEGSGTGVRLRINLGSERSVCCCRHNCSWPPQYSFVTQTSWFWRIGNAGIKDLDTGACRGGNSDSNYRTASVESLSLSHLWPLEIAHSKSGKFSIVTGGSSDTVGVYPYPTAYLMV